MNIKEILYAHCEQNVQERLNRIQEEIEKIQASANEETKSSAGDKYETGRAMAQLEIERSWQQLDEAKKLKQVLQGIGIGRMTNVVIPGSLIKTSNGIFYISISLGLVTIEQKKFLFISAESPIGKLLMGKKVNDSITWNRVTYTIKSIE